MNERGHDREKRMPSRQTILKQSLTQIPSTIVERKMKFLLSRKQEKIALEQSERHFSSKMVAMSPEAKISFKRYHSIQSIIQRHDTYTHIQSQCQFRHQILLFTKFLLINCFSRPHDGRLIHSMALNLTHCARS